MIWRRVGFGFSSVKVLVERKNCVGIVAMNSKGDRNCLSLDMNQQLSDAINALSRDQTIKMVVLTSKVPNLFCAGGDIKYFSTATYNTFLGNDIFHNLYQAIHSCRKPIISAINGIAMGGGWEITLVTDTVICSESSRFAMPQLKLGISTVMGASQRLPRISGKVNTARLVMGTETVSARRAYEMGIVTEVLPNEGFEEGVLEFCSRITDKDLEALIAAKDCIKFSEGTSIRHGEKYERKQL